MRSLINCSGIRGGTFSVTTLREFQNTCEMRYPAWRICAVLRSVPSQAPMGRHPYHLVPSTKVPT